MKIRLALRATSVRSPVLTTDLIDSLAYKSPPDSGSYAESINEGGEGAWSLDLPSRNKMVLT
jgi:hypothetical protein